jgi:hypothetical protein
MKRMPPVKRVNAHYKRALPAALLPTSLSCEIVKIAMR